MPAIKHILVVDDDGDVLAILRDILEDRNYRVSSAVDGITMRQFLEGDDPVDAIVLDAAMPGEARATLALHAKDLGLPLVVTSGNPDDMQFALDNGIQLLEKPFKAQDLVDAIIKALGSGEPGQRLA
jgi:DNA-binding NtrC family response regulator